MLKFYLLYLFSFIPLSTICIGAFAILGMPEEGALPMFAKLLAFIVLVFCILTYITICMHYDNLIRGLRKRHKSAKVVAAIRNQRDDFCIERFAAMAENRLKCIYYGDTMADIGVFSGNDFSDFLKKHDNVINCEIMNFWFKKCWQDSQNEYIEVLLRVVLTIDEEIRIVRRKRNVRMCFTRPVNSIMSTDFYHDWYVEKIEVVNWNGK